MDFRKLLLLTKRRNITDGRTKIIKDTGAEPDRGSKNIKEESEINIS